mmetsp:Transcript_26552/g.77238  ORF Transcript_26552/g.77238 Transcript_26552/m.77238 type:complete len:301 (+) Transcript_26552:80-982(+)
MLLCLVGLPPAAHVGGTQAITLNPIDGWAGVSGTAAEQPTAMGAGLVLRVPIALDSFKGPTATARYELVSLADTFGPALAEVFHASGSFRTALIGCARDVKVLFKIGTSLADSASDHDEEGCRERLGDVLRQHVGDRAPTADEFISSISSLCGDHWGGFTSFESKRPPPGALEWHQDWAAADLQYAFGACRTVMLAFPAAGASGHDVHEGEGILTELVQLSHEFSTESLKARSSYRGLSTGEQDRKAASDLGVTEEHIVRPRYCRGQEILVYKDAEHLHRSPRATSDPAGRARQAIWRFQ